MDQTVRPLAEAMGLRCATVHGGVSQGPQTAALRRGVDIVVATPGRLEDLIAQGHCRLGRRRRSPCSTRPTTWPTSGFLPAVKRLLDQTPAGSQRLLFSATLDNAVDSLVQRYLNEPGRALGRLRRRARPPSSSTISSTSQTADKAAVVAELASGTAGRCCSPGPSTAPASWPAS